MLKSKIRAYLLYVLHSNTKVIMFKKISLPTQLVGVILFVLLCGQYFNVTAIRGLYTFSVLFKEVLGMLLPFIVFSFVLSGILSFKKNAPLVLGILLAALCCSNALVAVMAYFTGLLILPCVSSGMCIEKVVMTTTLEPLYTFPLPHFASSEKALLLALTCGIIFSMARVPKVEELINTFKGYLEVLLGRFLIPLLPIYVLGFLLKMQYEGMFAQLFQQYGKAFIVIIMMQICYLLFLYFVATGFSLQQAFRAISNALPSYVTAFSTMSSTVTIPVSVKAAEENTGNRSLSLMAMPIMANVHLLGDSISTPTLAMVTMLMFTGALPNFAQYMAFVFYFCTTMFAVSGIPGGGIIVMIPVLKSQLGFTPDMISIIMALYLLLDSFGTAANVMGDGALVIIVNKILKRVGLA